MTLFSIRKWLCRKELAKSAAELERTKYLYERRLKSNLETQAQMVEVAAKEVWRAVVVDVDMEMHRHKHLSPERLVLGKVDNTMQNRFTERFGHRP